MKRLMIKTLLAAVALAALGTAYRRRTSERTFKFGLQNPKGHPLEQGREVRRTRGGPVGRQDQGQPVPRRHAGRRRATVSALQGGTVEMTALNSGILASR
jgi:TRAP-type C4-dicarboxylate transport system substrate-binding protein